MNPRSDTVAMTSSEGTAATSGFRRKRVSDLVIPWSTYPSPELAHVGIYENEKGIALNTFTQELGKVDRAILDGETEGFVRAFSTSDPQKLWLVTAQGKREIVIPRNVTNWVDVKGCVSPDGGFVALHVWQTHPNNKRSRSIHLGNLR